MTLYDEIKKMHPSVRMGGYLKHNALLCEYGAKLRSVKEDEEWTEEESEEWDRLCDELDPWFYALTDKEREALMSAGMQTVFGIVARGETFED